MISEDINKPANIPQLIEGASITNLMLMIWSLRPDLRIAFDIKTKCGQEQFLNWYRHSVAREYGFNESGTSEILAKRDYISQKDCSRRLDSIKSHFRTLSLFLPSRLKSFFRPSWLFFLAVNAKLTAMLYPFLNMGRRNIKLKHSTIEHSKFGANLIGYANAELGMGEHVRMSAAALHSTDIKFEVVNFDSGISVRKRAALEHGRIGGGQYKINIFHINADQMLNAYCRLGSNYFNGRYNIGYWAWELANCPEEWIQVMQLVDEIWAPSRFIQDAFSRVTDKPVLYMPLCVTLPKLVTRTRTYFGLPDHKFLFIFSFDFRSYIERKNPLASIRAFKKAFAYHIDGVGLVIKVMNLDRGSKSWLELLAAIDGDQRIYVIDKTLDRDDILALIKCCDSYISLHRSEGFGRGPAEAMYLAKPVIATNYSGNTDFTNSSNSCPVNYRLIDVKPDEYCFSARQVWAEPDLDHASYYMNKLFSDSKFANKIGNSGQEFIQSNFNQEVIGGIYSSRLKKLFLDL